MILSPTMADICRPGEKSQAILYNILLTLGGSIFIALSAQIAIGGPVPFTMQTFAVLLIGTLFGARLGSASVCLYLLEGFAGWPVFSHWRCGLPVLFGPTGGYLIGFFAAVYVTGTLAQRGWDRRVGTTILAMLIGNLFIYTFGLLWFSHLAGTRIALTSGLFVFIPGDIIKIALAAAILPSGWKLIEFLSFIKPKNI
jgi:biotin transport system substrate-specific component